MLVISVIAFPFTGAIIGRMRDDLIKNITSGSFHLIQTQPLELMMLELKLSLIIGILAALPIVFYYGYRYLSRLKLGERFKVSKATLVLVAVLAVALFLVGCAYSYFLMLPLVFQYLINSAGDAGVASNWRVSDFVNFAMLTTLVFGLVFELPLVMNALARSGIVSVDIFKKYRRHMWVIILIVAALVTSPDVITQIMVGVPLIIFYEISLFSMRFTVPKANAVKPLENS